MLSDGPVELQPSDVELSMHDLKVMDAVTSDDADWFDAHPGETVRYRPVVPGEFGVVAVMPPGVQQWCEVSQAGPGVRFRRVSHYVFDPAIYPAVEG